MLSDPPRFATTDHLELVEVNHFHDPAGKRLFDQVIFYRWNENSDHYDVVAWRMVKNPNQLPIKHPATGKYYLSWQDNKNLRVVYANDKLESWTQYDPETHERILLPKNKRSDLLRPDLRK